MKEVGSPRPTDSKEFKENYSNYTIEAVHKYYCLDNWSAYCKFLSENQTLTRPKLLKALEWNEIGYDEE